MRNGRNWRNVRHSVAIAKAAHDSARHGQPLPIGGRICPSAALPIAAADPEIMKGPILPGESPAVIRSIQSGRPTAALLPGESVAIADLCRLSYLRGIADAELPDGDFDPFY